MSDPRAIYLKDYQVPTYQIEQTELRFDLSSEATRVRARLCVQRDDTTSVSEPLVLDGEALTLISVAIDGRPLDAAEYDADEHSLTLHAVPDRFWLETEVEIAPASNTALEGLYQSNGMFCTQCEPEGFRRITFYPDRPDVMSRFTTTVIGDRTTLPVLLSNGNPIDQCVIDDARHYVTWEDPHPKPAYLFALVAGNLEKREDHFTTASGRDVLLQLWVETQNLNKTEFAMNALKRSMRWDEERFGREYDLDRFMIVAVDDFNMGAMENKGLNIFNSSAVLANPETTVDMMFQRIEGIVAHEYFHNWSGNRVTCRDWFQLALKEGFTVFRDQLFSSDVNSAPVKRIEDVALLRTAQFAEDSGPTAHPVRPDHFIEITNFYTLTVYEKGAEVVRMLRNLLGWEQFRQGSDLYFDRFDGQAVRVEDFIDCMAEVSGQDLTRFMLWYAQAGTPEVTATSAYDADARCLTLSLSQRTPPTPGQTEKEPLQIPVAMGLVGADGKDLPLIMNGESLGTSTVLVMTDAEHRFVFENLDAAPVPSLLRGFSAPVKLHHALSDEQLAFLMRHDSDGFNRWDAGQQLALSELERLMAAWHADEPLVVGDRLIDTMRALITEPADDKAVLAEMLRLPSEAFIAEQQAEVHIDAIHHARRAATRALGEALYDEFAALYDRERSDAPYSPHFEQIAQRSLKNVALGYLCATGRPDALALAQAQFDDNANMTDVRAALTQLAHADDTALGEPAVRAFGERWAHDPLVMDQWFATQVSRPQPDALERVRFLMGHEAFSIKNPNRVRALIGTFVNQNLVNFHREDGQGYRLLADVVIELNRLNPDIAARMVLPLTRFRRLDPVRRAAMRGELERIRGESLSRSVFEVVEKALAD
ncbi:aminopeptidase N [Larsenimonas rhizosphaerae]|uniref:Aminopeptidase N n=1 Tax=Larsenimonas rhizosphaerae TaxID=2944682 RepID=A0AA41ZEU4_9GAMM|nr:aminopeptidase N [Larsenimonas rhizosphaerae]MCX2523225.1 aminopeptidase N [Larsenimonas rhizosphaerae]